MRAKIVRLVLGIVLLGRLLVPATASVYQKTTPKRVVLYYCQEHHMFLTAYWYQYHNEHRHQSWAKKFCAYVSNNTRPINKDKASFYLIYMFFLSCASLLFLLSVVNPSASWPEIGQQLLSVSYTKQTAASLLIGSIGVLVAILTTIYISLLLSITLILISCGLLQNALEVPIALEAVESG